MTVDGVWIGDWNHIDHLQMETTRNCNTLANSCTLLTIAHTKSSQFVFTSRFLVTDPNNVLCLRPYWLATVSHQPPPLLFTD
jgi:hypothetical protein